MDYVELPEHLNFSHKGLYSPVSLRLEGGNGQGGFCIEEYQTFYPPVVQLHGVLGEARRMMMSAVKCLPAFIDMVLDGEVDEQIRSSNQGWFNFDYRNPRYRVAIYCGPNGVSAARNGIHPTHQMSVAKTQLRADLRAAYERLESIYCRFYGG